MVTSTKSTPIPTPDSITITIHKTVQVPKFEPVSMGITETYSVPPGADMDMYRRVIPKRIGNAVEDAIDREIKRYEPTNDSDE